MDIYALRYATRTEGERTIEFHADSTAMALLLAQNAAQGSWANLYRNDTLIARLRLGGSAGVWRIERVTDG